MEYASEKDFKSAPLGHSFMEACSACGQETGAIVIKKQGSISDSSDAYRIPKHLVTPDAHCEFCEVLGMWMGEQSIDPKETGLQYGVAKLVKGNRDKPELFAYVPFDSSEDRTAVLRSPDGTKTSVQLKHRMVIFCAAAELGDIGDWTPDADLKGNLIMQNILEGGV